MTPLIAVIVPVYNCEKDLPACVDSIRAQTFSDLEIILVDDGAKDSSGALCDRFAAEDERIRVIHKENGGLISAWTAGTKISTAPFLMYVDSDDWIEKDMAERLLAGMKKDPSDGTYATGQIVCSEGWIDRRGAAPEKLLHGLPPGIYEGEDLREKILAGVLGREKRPVTYSRCMKLFSRELIENNMHYADPRIRMAEDLTVTVPALADAERVVILEDAFLYHYIFLPESMAHGFNSGMYENAKLLRQIVHKIIADKGLDPAMEEEEHLMQLALAVKIILRGDPSAEDCVRRVREICLTEDTRGLAERYRGTVEDPANRLCLFVMRRPAGLRIRAVRAVFRAHAKKQLSGK